MENETWKPVRGHPEYEVSSHGRVRRLILKPMPHGGWQPSVMLRPSSSPSGYARVVFCINNQRNHHSVHRLVLSTFSDSPFKAQVNHRDGNKLNNHISNLEWVTPSENQAHAFKTGLWNYIGNKHWNCKLNPDAIKAIRQTNMKYGSRIVLAKQFGVSTSTIDLVRQGRTWRHI